jgi:pSer/pThr/pTyr-binding forkhead associated (FHA) protein
MSLQLFVVQGKPIGKWLAFRPGKYILGRGQECHVRFNSDWVSRQHCVLHVRHDMASIRDLGSRNGTLLNGQLLVGERFLRHGDRLQIGPIVFEAHLEATNGQNLSVLPPEELRGANEPTARKNPLDTTAINPILPSEH